jgi:hypothetical protein
VSEFELAEDFLPAYDVSDAVALVVEAEPDAVWEALLDKRDSRKPLRGGKREVGVGDSVGSADLGLGARHRAGSVSATDAR